MLATEYAKYHNIEPQAEGETDDDFKYRISGALRDQGHLIEAHEAHHDRRYDDPEGGDNVMTGIMGAAAMALQGVDFGSKGSSKVGDEIAAGLITKNPKPEMDPDMALLMVAMLGGKR